jgi:sugar O-acyltransferase (sialic acid O-acetyltransferase NeuD family)
MDKPNIVLIGAGDHAHACIDVIEQQGKYNIAGLVGMPHELGTKRLEYLVIATDSSLHDLTKIYRYACISAGQIHSPDIRIRLYQQAIELGFQLPLIIAPTAYVSRHANISQGTIVMNGAIINAGARIGSNCIINSRALIEYDVVVEDNCHISTGVVLNGRAKIGTGCFIGSGSVVKEGVSLGKECLVGMGVSLRNSLDDYTHFVGNEKYDK